MDRLLNLLLLVFSLYFFGIAIFTESVNLAPWNFYNIYTLLTLALIVAFSIVNFLKENQIKVHDSINLFNLKNGLLFLVISLMWFFIRYDVFVHGLIWFDEATQYVPFWSMSESIDSVKYASIQQQMPLDYYTSYAFLKIFGLNADAMLFHSRLYGILSCLVAYLIFLKLKFQKPIIIFAMVIFFSEATLLRYSSEARPIGLVIFLGLLNFYYFEKFLNSKSERFNIGLLASTLIFTLSTALQPLVHLFLISFLYKIKSESQLKRKVLDLNFILCLVMNLPLYWSIYIHTAGKVANFKSQNLTASFFDLFTNFNFTNFYSFDQFSGHILILTITLVVLAATIKSLISKTLNFPFANWIYLLFFPPLFVWAWSVMDWPLFSRYFAIWIAISTILIFQMLNSVYESYYKYLNRWFVIAISMLLILISHDYIKKQKIASYDGKTFPDLRQVFPYENKGTNNIYLFLPLMHPKDSGYYLDFTGVLYSTPNRYFWIEARKSLFHEQQKRLRKDLVSIFEPIEKFEFKKPFDLFVVVFCGVNQVNPICKDEFTDLKIDTIKPEVISLDLNHKVLIYRNQNDIISKITQTMSIVEEKLGVSPWLIDYYVSKMRYLRYHKKFNLVDDYVLKIKTLFNTQDFDNYFEKKRVSRLLDKFQYEIDQFQDRSNSD